MVTLLKKSKTAYLFKNLEKEGVIGAFSRRIFDYDLRAAKDTKESQKVLLARKNFFNSLNIKLKNSIFLEQPHRDKIFMAKAKGKRTEIFAFKESVCGVDAAITNAPGIALCLLTADCLPVIFFEPEKKIIGIAHAGWRGTKLKIVQKVVKKMVKNYNCIPSQISIYLAPGIRSCCYKVGRELKPFFLDFIRAKNNDLHLDLIRANKSQLLKVGIRPGKIFDTSFCTSCQNNEFFSYRRGDVNKRMLTVVCLPCTQNATAVKPWMNGVRAGFRPTREES